MFFFKKWRRKRLASRPFPQIWQKIMGRNVPYYNCLPDDDKAELRRHIHIFISEKRFEGCGGLVMSDEIKVTIAAQACILLLHRETDYYPGLHTILVYPHAFVVRRPEMMESGVVSEDPHVLLGESWHDGSIVLSWDDVRGGAADINDGHNVVFHEFAHQIDSSFGKGDNSEVLRDRSSFSSWARVLRKDFEALRVAAVQGRPTLLDKYGAKNPAEFFAVITEFFFEKPLQLRRNHPELYEELRLFYHQDPAEYMI